VNNIKESVMEKDMESPGICRAPKGTLKLNLSSKTKTLFSKFHFDPESKGHRLSAVKLLYSVV